MEELNSNSENATFQNTEIMNLVSRLLIETSRKDNCKCCF